MNKSDMDFISKFALTSSAALIIASCSTGCVYGPPPPYDQQRYNDSPELESVPISPHPSEVKDFENVQKADNHD